MTCCGRYSFEETIKAEAQGTLLKDVPVTKGNKVKRRRRAKAEETVKPIKAKASRQREKTTLKDIRPASTVAEKTGAPA